MSEHKRIFEEFEKKLPSKSTLLFRCGCILLGSISIGLGLLQFWDVSPYIAPEDVKDARLALGLTLGLFLAVLGLLIFMIITWISTRKLAADATEQMVQASLRSLNQRR